MSRISAAGKRDGETEGQVDAIENLIASGAKRFALVPIDSKGIVATVKTSRVTRKSQHDHYSDST